MALLTLVLAGLQACAVAPYEPGIPEPPSMTERATVLQQNAFTVRASVPGEQEAETIFGFPIYARGIQPVWLEIRNDSPTRARFILTSVDDDYFSPFEVAYMNKKYFSKQGWMDMEKFLYRNAMPRMIAAGGTASGYVYTHVEPGTKNINVDIFHAADDSRHEEFTFFLEVPGFVPDHADVDFKQLYTQEEITDTDPKGLKTLLETLPCCFSDRSGDGNGQPANIVLVGPGLNVLRALIRAGWSETSYEKDDNYLNNSNYLFDRPPDAVFRKSRGKTTERNELSLWLAPVRVDGEPVWFGQVRHAIGRRFDIGELFFGTALDPDIDDGRNYLLQNLWYNRSLLAFAYSDTLPVVPANDPATDFNGNPWFSDGVRIVMWVSGEPVSLNAVRNLLWLKLPGQPELKP
jgi:hypothetical protein